MLINVWTSARFQIKGSSRRSNINPTCFSGKLWGRWLKGDIGHWGSIGMRWGGSIGRDLCLTEQGWGEGGILRPSLFPLLPPRDPCYTNPLHATLRLRPIHSLVFTLTPPRPESSSACNPFASMVCLINRSWTESQIPLKLNLEVPTLLLRFIGFVKSLVESFIWTWD